MSDYGKIVPGAKHTPLPDLIMGSAEDIRKAQADAVPTIRINARPDPLDTAAGPRRMNGTNEPLEPTARRRVNTTESLKKNSHEVTCDQCHKPAAVLLFDQNHTNGKCPSCVGEGALVRPVTQAKCGECGRELP